MGFFSKDIKTMDDLFVHTLRDIYYAEKQIVQSLHEMIERETDPQLKRNFETHLGESKNHVTRVRSSGCTAKSRGWWIVPPSTASSTRLKTWPAKSRTNRFS